MFEIKPVGFKKFQRKLNSLERRARGLQGTQEIPLSELLPPTFLRTHTPFASLDVRTPSVAIEVETAKTVKDGLRQLRGFRRRVYIAAADQRTLAAALEATKGKTVGVMDEHGNIVKRSTRKIG